jgi:ATP-binding cassette, subfamily B, multidrug efflux pump
VISDKDQIVASYSPKVMKRLLRYLTPYAQIVTIAVFALLIATGAELLLPIIMQRTIDTNIVVHYFRVPVDVAGDMSIAESSIDNIRIDGYRYFHEDTLRLLPGDEKQALRERNALTDESWYVFSTTGRAEDLRELLTAKPGLFILGSSYGAIRTGDMRLLSIAEKQVLRKDDITGVSRAAVRFLLLLVSVLLTSFAQVYLMTLVGQRVMKDMRLQLFSHTVKQSLSYLGRTPIGGLVTRVTNDVETMSELFTNIATAFLKDIAVIAGVLIALFALNSRLALVVLATTPPTILATWYFRKKGREAYRKVRHWVAQVNTFLSEHISGMDVVQMFGREKRSSHEFLERNEGLKAANLRENRIMAYFRPLIDMFTSVSIGLIIYFGAGMRMRDAVSLGVLIAFINLVGRFYKPIQDISEKFTLLQSAMAGGERIFDLLDTDTLIPDKTNSSGMAADDYWNISGKIEFKNVTFGYNPEDPVLTDVSFSVEPGETVALVGYTGAGKTTIINLLARLWDVQEGAICIDGKDIRELPLSQLRGAVQPVQQDVFLFSGSIEENLALGRAIEPDKIRQAAAAVEADAFIGRLPHGYSTELQEGGANLSSGQRQLLSFARTLAGDPRIIVLDEATSSIDTETEKLVQAALERLLEGRTSLVIAHRLSTIRYASRILVLSHGHLAESGTHEELIAEDGLYASLYRLQYESQ